MTLKASTWSYYTVTSTLFHRLQVLRSSPKSARQRSIFCFHGKLNKGFEGNNCEQAASPTLPYKITIVKMFVYSFHNIVDLNFDGHIDVSMLKCFDFSFINISPLYKRSYNPQPKSPYFIFS